MADALKRQARELQPLLIEWRRDFHRHPELGFEEERTAEVVRRQLDGLGLEVQTGVARTGVVGVLRREGGASAPAVLLRADMDALPVQEVEGRDYGSEHPGKMHACGHDGHMAMLLGAARLLSDRRGELSRDVVFCFQPAEEGAGGGRLMIEEGIVERHGVERAYALHLWSQFDSGTVHLRSGPIMAAQDEFRAVIHGAGGHGALPHRAIDPITAAAQGVTSLQSIVAREVDPVASAVVTVGRLQAGEAPNVIPDRAELAGTLRSFLPEVRQLLRERVTAVLEGVAAAHRCRAEVEIAPGYPAVVNDAEAAARARRAAAAVVGDDGVIETPPMAASEDFAYFLERIPGAFAFLGAGRADRPPHHSPRFDIDESVLPLGAELLARLALQPD